MMKAPPTAPNRLHQRASNRPQPPPTVDDLVCQVEQQLGGAHVDVAVKPGEGEEDKGGGQTGGRNQRNEGRYGFDRAGGS
jgi:hypothetical protein